MYVKQSVGGTVSINSTSSFSVVHVRGCCCVSYVCGWAKEPDCSQLWEVFYYCREGLIPDDAYVALFCGHGVCSLDAACCLASCFFVLVPVLAHRVSSWIVMSLDR